MSRCFVVDNIRRRFVTMGVGKDSLIRYIDIAMRSAFCAFALFTANAFVVEVNFGLRRDTEPADNFAINTKCFIKGLDFYLHDIRHVEYVVSEEECARACHVARDEGCKAFTLNKSAHVCFAFAF